MNRDTSFFVLKDNHICVENNIMVYEKQLKVGLQKGACILLNSVYRLRIAISPTVMAFHCYDPYEGGRLCKIDSEGHARQLKRRSPSCDFFWTCDIFSVDKVERLRTTLPTEIIEIIVCILCASICTSFNYIIDIDFHYFYHKCIL